MATFIFYPRRVKAIWNGQVVAESDDIVTVDGYHYFPRSAMKADFFRESDRTSECHCKGIARYCDLEVNGQTCVTPVWSYESPTKAFDKIKLRIAFFSQSGGTHRRLSCNATGQKRHGQH